MRPKARWIIVKYHSRPLPVIAHVSFFAFAVIWLSIIATSGRRIPAAYLFIKGLRFEGVARTRLLLSSMIYVHWLSDVTKWHHNTGNKILLNSNSRAFRKKKTQKTWEHAIFTTASFTYNYHSASGLCFLGKSRLLLFKLHWDCKFE